MQYQLQKPKNGSHDNLVADGQVLLIPPGRYHGIHILASAETTQADGYITANYSDGSLSTREVSIPPWWLWAYPSGGDIVMPFYYTNQSNNYNKSNIFQRTLWIDPSKYLTSLEMPRIGGSNRLHIFAVTLSVALADDSLGPQLQVDYARSTKKYLTNAATQIFEVTISNIDEKYWVMSNDSVGVSIESKGVTTLKPGAIKRLRPGDRVIVQVAVENKESVEIGTTGIATVRLKSSTIDISHDFMATFGIGPYEPTYESIFTHESPDWYNGAKFGIFIHWGIYSIPAWVRQRICYLFLCCFIADMVKRETSELTKPMLSGENAFPNPAPTTNTGRYWWNLNSGPDGSDGTYEHHLLEYGPGLNYDDFMAEFTATAYDPRDWVDLFEDSGAKYFVQVAKHHDGYAMYGLPLNVSQRTSVIQFPHRDFIKEIFDAAAKYQPQLHRASYYSLPEWFHPDYLPYGFGRWPGGNATNPFTNTTLPYTGYVPVNDYLKDVVLPEMQTLAQLGTEIMWCDIGGPNVTVEFASQWYNAAISQNRQVVMNNRCGIPGDFDTPEYSSFSATQQRKWESNAGSKILILSFESYRREVHMNQFADIV